MELCGLRGRKIYMVLRISLKISHVLSTFPKQQSNILRFAIEPTDRGTISSTLTSDLHTKKPLVNDPSCLQKYPPSKES